MHVHLIVHESYEAPGAFDAWVKSRGFTSSYSRVYLGDSLPHASQGIDLLIVLGGPQSPSTTTLECPHFDAAAEKALIAQSVRDGKAVVGVCLGSQLIGEALGANYHHSPEKEIGKFPIVMTEAGRNNAKFKDFGNGLDVGHWHNDMPGLTKNAKIIATSEGCPRQIVEYTNLVYGFQCHMEFTPEVIALLLTATEAEFPSLINYKFVQQPEALREHEFSDMNQKLFGFLDKLVEAYRCETVSSKQPLPLR